MGVEYEESLSSPHMSFYSAVVSQKGMSRDGRQLPRPYLHLACRRLFNPTLDRVPLAPPCPSRLPKIKIQTRRLLPPSPLKDRRPAHCSSSSSPTSASSSLVAPNSHSSPWRTTRTTRRYVPSHPAPHVLLPHPLGRCLSPFAPRLLSTCAPLTSPCTDPPIHSMSTPSTAPMPVPPSPTPCSALL